MGNIVLLDDLTINKIAAGEVIERPASVIKEMVENSIDAGANNITVEIKNGGISLIKITDNGKGIAEDDLEIAFERHATSKIRKAEDLDVVTSMGFRGEALASIAAIANVEMITKTESQDTGFKIVVEAGNILQKQEVGCQKGTSITVRNLFFNTPVRYKFLKKDYTESGYVEDVITRIALVNPDIAIKLINSGKTVIQTNGNGDIKSVIYSIFGKDVATGIIPVQYTYEDMQLTGVIGKPEIARSNRANQLFFINKRFVKDKTLTAATEQAFKGLIPIGKFGFLVLNIEMNPSKVDVNVHPAKLEVRFQDEGSIFKLIYHGIKDTLLKNELVANTEKQEENVESEGLFDYRKNEAKKIEEYTKQESEIKTNIINFGQGGPVNTADVLEQLRKMQQELEKQVEENPTIKLNPNYIEMREQSAEVGIDVGEVEVSEVDVGEIEVSEVEVSEMEVGEVEVGEIEISEMEVGEVETSEIEVGESEVRQEIQDDAQEQLQENVSEELQEEFQESTEEIQENVQEGPEEKLEVLKEQINKLENLQYNETLDFNEMYEKLFGTMPTNLQAQENKSEEPKNTAVDLIKDNISVFEDIEEYNKPTYKFIGIVFNTYIIIEIDKEMYIIDQHAAHERIMYEKVKNNYYSESSKDSQMLLLPDIITLSHKEMSIARDNIEMFEKAGFSLEEFGDNTIKLTGVPTICINLDNRELFLETLDEIDTVARTAKQEKEEKFIATVACKAAVKANMVLEKEEVETLMDKLLELPNPFTCPHGRPTAIKMTKYDIERKFARK